MKKTILKASIILSGIIASVTTAKAQEGFQIGIQGTPQFSWLMNQDDNSNNKFQYVGTFNSSFGISSQYGFTERHAIGLNLLYSYQGQRFKLNSEERVKKVEYVKIPLLYVYNYSISENVRFIGKIGPQLNLLTNAMLTDKDGNNIVSDQKSAYENAELDIVGSAGFGFMLTDNFMLDAALRYDVGITNAEKANYPSYVNDPLRSSGINGSNRAMTNNMTAGLTIGLRYLFSK